MTFHNFFNDLPKEMTKEVIEPILNNKNIRMERIVSNGQCSQPNFWYDQAENEFILILQGHAELEFEKEVKTMSPGDHLMIPSHCKHRVKSTSQTEPTIWLAVFYSN